MTNDEIILMEIPNGYVGLFKKCDGFNKLIAYRSQDKNSKGWTHKDYKNINFSHYQCEEFTK